MKILEARKIKNLEQKQIITYFLIYYIDKLSFPNKYIYYLFIIATIGHLIFYIL